MAERSTRRLITLIAVGGFFAPVGSSAQEPETTFGTEVEVRRIITEVRAVDSDGSPILGLGPDDFRVKVGGKKVDVESVLWVPTTGEAAAAAEAHTEQSVRTPEPRLIVVVFQTDYRPNAYRLAGLVRMAPHAKEFVENLGPGDRVALLSFGSHLQLRADFTDDHQAIADMISTTKVLENVTAPRAARGPSMADHLDPDEAKRAATMARALELIGEALQPIPGPKSLVFFGFALGSYTAGTRITHDNSYRLAMEALTNARTSVFSLDITDADYHSLELGMETVSRDTGGFYVKTHIFPDFAMKKLARVISSYYELSLIPPPKLGKRYTIKVKVKRPGVDVYVRQDHSSGIMF
jgi:VWFA-related protein